MEITDLNDRQKAEITAVKEGLRISKVVCTRSVKTRNGDYFVGMSAAWDSTQEDAGGGATLIDAMGEGEQEQAIVSQGMTRKQAKIAGLILGMQVDLQATHHALGGGALSTVEHRRAVNAIRHNYSKLLAAAVASKSEDVDKAGERNE